MIRNKDFTVFMFNFLVGIWLSRFIDILRMNLRTIVRINLRTIVRFDTLAGITWVPREISLNLGSSFGKNRLDDRKEGRYIERQCIEIIIDG